MPGSIMLESFQEKQVVAEPILWEENELLISFTGLPAELKKLKKKLTLHDRSAYYQLNILKKQAGRLASKINKKLKENPELKEEHCEEYEKLVETNQQIEEVQDKTVRTYYEEVDGKIVAPAGFWFLAQKQKDNFHLNNYFEYVKTDGLRDYQKECVQELVKYKRATCVLATGLGKTWCMLAIAKASLAANRRVLIIVPSEYLVLQVMKTMKQLTDSVTGASSSIKHKTGQMILVSTVGTAKKFVDMYDTVLVDESHHSSAATWEEVLSLAQKPTNVYSFTATPDRADGLGFAVRAFCGPIVYEKDVSWGIQNNYLQPFDVYMVYVTPKWPTTGKPIKVSDKSMRATAHKKLVTNHVFLTTAAQYLMKSIETGRKVIVVVNTLIAAKKIVTLCKKHGHNLSVADADYKKPLFDFSKGETPALIATPKLIGEGVDIPFADTLIMCTQHSSETMTLQPTGRVLRPDVNKKRVRVIDIVALGYQPYLESAKKRLKTWKKIADTVYYTKGKDG